MSDLFSRLHELVTALQEERETEEQAAELARLLRGSAEARRLYLTYVSDSVTLHLRAHAAIAQHEQPRRWWSLGGARLAWGTVMGLAVALVVALWRAGEPAPTYRGVAVLARSVDAEWDTPRATGGILAAGALQLRRGLAQIEFFSGATMVVEGPAELDLVSSLEVFVRKGKVRATVPPPARGFMINGPGLGVIDLGTELGVSVGEGGSEVHVFDGEVELRPPATAERLKTGQGVIVDPRGRREAARAAPAFVDQAGLARLDDDELGRRHARWLEHSHKLRQDPSVVLYYTFEDSNPWERVVRSQAKHATVDLQSAQGAIVGCRWTSGRWPLKKALEFKSPGDRVRLHIPGQFDSMTFAAWVRVDGFDRTWISLFLTDDWDRGEPHWQMSRKGEMILGVRGPGNHFSPEVLSAHHLGRWVHLATVYDRATLTVTHYLDGRAAGSQPIRSYVPLVVGAAEIGNWGMPMARAQDQIRNFNGVIDELVVLGRALGAGDIASMYEAGRPQ